MVLCGCACIVCGSAQAEPPSSAIEEQAAPDRQPPRLLQQVELSYPEAALATGEHGDVSVLVDVDAAGAVTATRFEHGADVFREVALEAASRLIFAPAVMDGTPVAATTRIWFHFAPPERPTEQPIAEMVIHSDNVDQEDTRARTTLDEEALERLAGDDLARTVSQVAGVRLSQGTTDAAKPIVRGLQERRLLVLYDGVRHESQKWGPDHATEVDPFAAGSISVIRGAAGARYGPDAIGGVIVVEPPPMPTEAGVFGKMLTAYSSNGRRPYGAVRLDVASEGRWSARMEGNAATGSSLTAPDYILGNTASRSWNVGGAVAYQWPSGQVRASWHHHDFQAGVFYGVNNSTPDEFLAQLEGGRPVTADLWSITATIDRPYQDVSHDVGIVHADVFGDWGGLEVTYAFQINLRQEYEQTRDTVTGPQYDFTLRTHSLDGQYLHPEIEVLSGVLSGGVGVQGVFQENVYRGYSLLPNYRSFGGGIFVHERLSRRRVDLVLGGRLDGLARAVYMSDDDYQRHVSRGSLDETKCEQRADHSRCPTAYDTGSLSVGMLYHAVPEHMDIKFDLSTASRFPNADELYLIGNAPSFPVYALGHPDLGVETALGASLTPGLRLSAFEMELSGFVQSISDYIYFSPDLNENGEPRFDVTIQGTWPRYTYQAIDARLHGVDGAMKLGPQAPVGLEVQGGLVRAQDRATGAHLIGIPADHLRLSVVGRPPAAGIVDAPELRVITEMVAAQSRVDPSDDFAPAPPGYVLLGADVSMELGTFRVGVEGRNLLNTAYREYTSLLRYYADQPGRDVRLRVGADF